MHEVLRARHDANMAVPEHEVAAGERGAVLQFERVTDLFRLHVGVARARKPGGLARKLHQARAIDAEAGAAAPQIGRAAKAKRDIDEIAAQARRASATCSAMTKPPPASARNLPSCGRRRQKRIQAQQRERRRLDVGARIDIGAERGDLVRRRRDRGALGLRSACSRHRPSRASCTQAQPSLSSNSVSGLAEQRLGIERRIEARLTAQGQRRRLDLAALARNVARRFDTAAQRLCGEPRAISVAARVWQHAAHHGPNSLRK